MAQEPQLVFLRDLSDVEPPRDRYTHYDEEDIYRLVPRPQWTGLAPRNSLRTAQVLPGVGRRTGWSRTSRP